MRQRTLPVFIKKGVGSLDELRRTSKIRQYQKSKGKNVNKLLLKLSSMSMNTTITDRNYGKTCVKQYYRGRGWILNTLFKIPIISCHWLSELYKKKKKAGVWCKLLQITQICSYESDYVTLHSKMSIITKNCAKITHRCRNINFKGLLSGTCQ